MSAPAQGLVVVFILQHLTLARVEHCSGDLLGLGSSLGLGPTCSDVFGCTGRQPQRTVANRPLTPFPGMFRLPRARMQTDYGLSGGDLNWLGSRRRLFEVKR